jgi:hypothetical protein
MKFMMFFHPHFRANMRAGVYRSSCPLSFITLRRALYATSVGKSEQRGNCTGEGWRHIAVSTQQHRLESQACDSVGVRHICGTLLRARRICARSKLFRQRHRARRWTRYSRPAVNDRASRVSRAGRDCYGMRFKATPLRTIASMSVRRSRLPRRPT